MIFHLLILRDLDSACQSILPQNKLKYATFSSNLGANKKKYLFLENIALLMDSNYQKLL